MIKQGMILDNYRDFCRVFALEHKTSGKCRKRQEKYVSNFVLFGKMGHKYIIYQILKPYEPYKNFFSRKPVETKDGFLIPLAGEKGCALIDVEDFNLVTASHWHLTSGGYAARGDHEYMHRLITTAPTNLIVDHINGDRLDNRKENLRVVSKAQNNRNMTKARGTSYSETFDKWSSSITHHDETTHLGYYDTEAEAHAAYRAARILFGLPLPVDQA